MNPYASPYHRAIILAYLRRAGWPGDFHPVKAARIARRYDRVLTYSKVVDCDGCPLLNSWWRRKRTGFIWQVIHWRLAGTVQIHLPGSPETETYTLPDFFEKFEPWP